MAKPKPERRKSERYHVGEAWVEYAESSLLGLFKRTDTVRVPLENVGVRGLCMNTPAEFKPGKSLAVKITVPFMTEPAESRALVIWCQRAPQSRNYLVGIRFEEQESAFRAWMDEFGEKAGDIPVPVRCPHCQHAFTAKQWLIGKSAKCQRCKKTIQPLERLVGTALRSAESVLEAMDDMEGADGGTVKASVLNPRIQHFLMKYIASPMHLALIEYIYGREGTRIDLPEAAKALDCRERDVVQTCQDLVALDILKLVNDVFIYNPDMVAKRDVNDFMKDYGNPKIKPKVLAFVMAAHEEKPS